MTATEIRDCFFATPSTDPMQSLNARLGLNGIEQNTSDPSGRAGAAALTAIWSAAADKLQAKMKDVSAAVDKHFGPQIEKIKATVDGVGEWMKENAPGSAGDSRRVEATLDASFAAQQFGGRSREVELLTSIDKNTRKSANARVGMRIGNG